MTYEEKMSAALAAVQTHNERMTAATMSAGLIDLVSFQNKIKAMGGTNSDALSLCSWEDLTSAGLPTLLAKQVAAIFRASDPSAPARKHISALRATSMSVPELLEVYDPREQNPVADRLQHLAHNKPCIVFNADGFVNVEQSATIIQSYQQGYDAWPMAVVNGTPTKVYEVGQRPDALADENPLYPGRKLRPDQSCDQTLRSWEGISHEVRVILHLARTQTNELAIKSQADAHDVLDLVTANGDALAKVRQRYPHAAMRYQEMLQCGTVPTLKVPLGTAASAAKPVNPFGVNKAY